MDNIRAIETLNQRELEAGVALSASWHSDWSDTAYIFIGGLPYELSEGDIVTIFSQFGEPAHVNLIRDKDTGKSKGFAFLKYKDQRSTNLAVDNLGGTTVLGRIIRVDHTRYKPKDHDEVDENAHANFKNRAKGGDENEVQHKSRRGRNDDSSEGDSYRRQRTPRRDIFKEELELEKLIRDHDEEDPMKEYLIREKKEEVQMALESLKMAKKSSKHRNYNERHSRSEHKHRSYRQRSRSKEPSKCYRSWSTGPRHAANSPNKTNLPRDKYSEDHEEKVSGKDETTGKTVWREKGKSGGMNGRSWYEQKEGERGRWGEREQQ